MENLDSLPSQKNSEIFELYADESDAIEDEKMGIYTPMLALDPDVKEYRRIARIEKVFNDVENFEFFINNNEQRLMMNHPNILSMLDYAYAPLDADLSSFEVYGFYEMCDTDLREEIGERFENNNFFTDLHIFNIIKNVISGLAFLQRNSLIHGDIRYIIKIN